MPDNLPTVSEISNKELVSFDRNALLILGKKNVDRQVI